MKNERRTLQEMLSEASVSQVEMAILLGLSESQVSLIVNGHRRMSLDYAAVFARRINTTIDTIFCAVEFAKCKVLIPEETSATLEKTG